MTVNAALLQEASRPIGIRDLIRKVSDEHDWDPEYVRRKLIRLLGQGVLRLNHYRKVCLP